VHLFQLKEYPPEASPASIRDFIDRLARLRSMGVSDIDLIGFSPQLISHLAQMARKYDVQALSGLRLRDGMPWWPASWWTPTRRSSITW
jgi:hypothetical protein